MFTGVDILHLPRLQRVLEADVHFLEKVYTEAERQLAKERPDPLAFYAGRFAAKEAVFKALAMSPSDFRLDQVEVLAEPEGRPLVTLHGAARQAARETGITKVDVSISYDGEYVTAFAAASMTESWDEWSQL